MITDTGGAIVHQYEYEAFGRMATDFGTNSSETKYTYTNQEFDPESGLFYYNARYYNPRLGRFLSRDTVLGGDGDVLSRNLNIYVKNNPLKYVDPTGRQAADLAVMGGLALSDGPLPVGEALAVGYGIVKLGMAISNVFNPPSPNIYVTPVSPPAKPVILTTPVYQPQKGDSIIVDPIPASGGVNILTTPVYTPDTSVSPFPIFSPSANSNNTSFPSSIGGKCGVNMSCVTSGGAPKPAKNFIPPTNPPQNPTIPKGYVSGPTDNGRGTIYRPPGPVNVDNRDANSIHVYDPTQQYPDGYWKQHDSAGNPINPSTGKAGGTRGDYHVPRPSKNPSTGKAGGIKRDYHISRFSK